MSRVIASGQRGLDLVLGGGVVAVERVPGREGATVLIRGPAGSGKTLLGLQLALAIARAERTDVVYACVEILPSEVEAQFRSHRPDQRDVAVYRSPFETVAPEGQPPRLFAALLPIEDHAFRFETEIDRLLGDPVFADTPPRVLVVDSLIEGYGLGSSVKREFADDVCKLAASRGMFVVLLEEADVGRPSPWVFAADTVIELGEAREDRDRGASGSVDVFERRLAVTKHRYSASDAGPHRFAIETGRDIEVYPRPSAYRHAWVADLLWIGRNPRPAADTRWRLPGVTQEQATEAENARPFAGSVTGAYGPDAVALDAMVRLLGAPGTDAGAARGRVLRFDLSHAGPPTWTRRSPDGIEALITGIGEVYASPHRALDAMLEAVGHASEHVIGKIEIGDLRALRSLWSGEGVRRSISVFVELMRARRIPVILFESAAPRIGIVGTASGAIPQFAPGIDTPAVVDHVDVIVELRAPDPRNTTAGSAYVWQDCASGKTVQGNVP